MARLGDGTPSLVSKTSFQWCDSNFSHPSHLFLSYKKLLLRQFFFTDGIKASPLLIISGLVASRIVHLLAQLVGRGEELIP
jgi:hypothetical protein